MRNAQLFIALVFCVSTFHSQIIRKNYQEMTTSEQTDYNSALNILWNSGATGMNDHAGLAAMHSSHFASNIHSNGALVPGYNFTSFHRFFMLHWELLMKNTGASYEYLCLPYWDWRSDPVHGASPPSAVTDPDFWEYTLLPSASFISWGVSRVSPYPAGNSLPNAGIVSGIMPTTNFQGPTTPNFSQDLESVHGFAHGYVGGTMGTALSPLDPVFYLHHAMVDKIWADWADQPSPPTFAASFPALPGVNPIPGYRTADGWIDDLDPNDCIDHRMIPFRFTTAVSASNYDVWYAETGRVILDGTGGTDFQVNGNGKIYRYTAKAPVGLRGDILIGDLYRIGNTIYQDNKGGFSVPAGTSAHFRAGGSIEMLPGASFYANSSSEVTFKIISAPNGF